MGDWTEMSGADWDDEPGDVGSTDGMGRYIEWVPTEYLRPMLEHDRDANGIPGRTDAVLDSLNRVGFKNPVWVDFNDQTNMAHLSEGNHRVTVALRAGIPAVPVSVIRSGRVPQNTSILRPHQYVGGEVDHLGEPAVPQYMRPSEIGMPTTEPWVPRQARTASPMVPVNWDALRHPRDQYVGEGPTFPGDREQFAHSSPEYQAWLDQARPEFQAKRLREEEWDHAIRHALATGKIAPEQAVELGFRPQSHEGHGDWGEPKWGKWQPLPSKLYHVTTNLPAVLADGRLKSPYELDLEAGRGLGSLGRDKTVSLTDSLDEARNIKRAMLEGADVASGRLPIERLVEMARTGEGADKPWLKSIFGTHDWSTGNPQGLDDLLLGRKPFYTHLLPEDHPLKGMSSFMDHLPATEWAQHGYYPRANAYALGTPGNPDYPRYTAQHVYRNLTPEEKAIEAFEWWRNPWAAMRWHVGGGPSDPLFTGVDPHWFANLHPSHVGIVETEPVPGGHGYPLSSLGEWRIPTGEAVNITGVDGQPLPLRTSSDNGDYGNERLAMAEHSGDPELDSLIQAFMASDYFDDEREAPPEAWSPHPENPAWETRFPVEDLRDPQWADNFCAQASDQFVEFLKKHGVQAELLNTEQGGGIKGLGYGDMPGSFGGYHVVVKVQRPSGTYMVDWTASQYGYNEFPMVQRLDNGQWDRSSLGGQDRMSASTHAERLRAAQQHEMFFGADKSQTVHTYPDGWTLRRLVTNGDAHREGTLMGNCYRRPNGENDNYKPNVWTPNQDDYGDYIKPGHEEWTEWPQMGWEIGNGDDHDHLSLRDPDNLPHLTVEQDSDGDLLNAYGRHNSEPKFEYVDRLKQWVDSHYPDGTQPSYYEWEEGLGRTPWQHTPFSDWWQHHYDFEHQTGQFGYMASASDKGPYVATGPWGNPLGGRIEADGTITRPGGASWIPTAEDLSHEASTEPQRSWHLTDRHDFALDPEYAPEDNSMSIFDRSGRKGLYLGDPSTWFHTQGYVRPFVAEIEHPPAQEGRWGGEKFLTADQFPASRVHRVIPFAQWEQETHGGGQREGLEVEPGDVRHWTPEQAAAYKEQVNQYIKTYRPEMLRQVCERCADDYTEPGKPCPKCGYATDWDGRFYSRVASSRVMYHNAPRDRRESILRHGVDFTKGKSGTDYQWFGQTPGNYLWADPEQAEHDRRAASDGSGLDFDTFAVDTSGLNLQPDTHWEGTPTEAHFTTQPIPAQAVRLHAPPDWHEAAATLEWSDDDEEVRLREVRGGTLPQASASDGDPRERWSELEGGDGAPSGRAAGTRRQASELGRPPYGAAGSWHGRRRGDGALSQVHPEGEQGAAIARVSAMEPWFPAERDAIIANQKAYALGHRLFGDSPVWGGVLKPDQLSSALAAARNHWAYGPEESDRERLAQAGAKMAWRISGNQVFQNGNKRTAFWLTRHFLDQNGLGHLSPHNHDDAEFADHLIAQDRYGADTSLTPQQMNEQRAQLEREFLDMWRQRYQQGGPTPGYVQKYPQGTYISNPEAVTPTDEEGDLGRSSSDNAVYAAVPPVMYHVAPQAARESILRHGLDASRGDRMWPDQEYPVGNYLHADWYDAHARAAQQQDGMFGWHRDPEPHDIWQVNTRDLSLEPDPLLADGGDAYKLVRRPIPPTHLSVVPDWVRYDMEEPEPPREWSGRQASAPDNRGSDSSGDLPDLDGPDAAANGYESLGDPYWGAGGCAHLALAMHSLHGLPIAAHWYDDHGRESLSHAWAYNPATNKAYDHAGVHSPAESPSWNWSGGRLDMNADPRQIAEHMGIRWSPEEPWLSDNVTDAAEFANEHFLPTRQAHTSGDEGRPEDESCPECGATDEYQGGLCYSCGYGHMPCPRCQLERGREEQMGDGTCPACGYTVATDGVRPAADITPETPGLIPPAAPDALGPRREGSAPGNGSYDPWMMGGCGHLAREIHRRTGWPIMGVYSDFPAMPDHIFVQHPSGQMLDSRGLAPMPPNAIPVDPTKIDEWEGKGWTPSRDELPPVGEAAEGLLRRQGSAPPVASVTPDNGRYGAAPWYFHISPRENRESIRANGLRLPSAGSPYIWMFDDEKRAREFKDKRWGGSGDNDLWRVNRLGINPVPDPHSMHGAFVVDHEVPPENLELWTDLPDERTSAHRCPECGHSFGTTDLNRCPECGDDPGVREANEARAPSLDALIAQYRKEFWQDAKSVTPGEVEGTCTEYSHELADYLNKHGIPAEVRFVNHPSDLGYTDRTRVPDPDEGHAVVVAGGQVIDFTAAQYGYPEFPKVFPDPGNVPWFQREAGAARSYRGVWLGDGARGDFDPGDPEQVLGRVQSYVTNYRQRHNIEFDPRHPLFGQHWTSDPEVARRFAVRIHPNNYPHVNYRERSNTQAQYGVVFEARHDTPGEAYEPNRGYGEQQISAPGRDRISKVIAHVHVLPPGQVGERERFKNTLVHSFEVPEPQWREGSVEANILDPVKDTLDPAVFDDAGAKLPRLKPALREWLHDTIFNILEQGGYEGPERWASLYLTGSLTTYQYAEHSDCDVSIFVNHHVFPEWSRAEMIGLMVEHCDGLNLPGTPHQLQVYVVAKGIEPGDLYQPGLRSGYDLGKDEWVVAPERERAHDVAHEDPEGYATGLMAADKMERLLRYEPDKAVMYYGQLHRKRMADQKAAKGDYATSNLIYKMLDNRGLFDQLRELGVKVASEARNVSDLAWQEWEQERRLMPDLSTPRTSAYNKRDRVELKGQPGKVYEVFGGPHGDKGYWLQDENDYNRMLRDVPEDAIAGPTQIDPPHWAHNPFYKLATGYVGPLTLEGYHNSSHEGVAGVRREGFDFSRHRRGTWGVGAYAFLGAHGEGKNPGGPGEASTPIRLKLNNGIHTVLDQVGAIDRNDPGAQLMDRIWKQADAWDPHTRRAALLNAGYDGVMVSKYLNDPYVAVAFDHPNYEVLNDRVRTGSGLVAVGGEDTPRPGEYRYLAGQNWMNREGLTERS